MREVLNWLCRHIVWGSIFAGAVWFAQDRQRLDEVTLFAMMGVIVALCGSLESVVSNAVVDRSTLKWLVNLLGRALVIYLFAGMIYVIVILISGGKVYIEGNTVYMEGVSTLNTLIELTIATAVLWIVLKFSSIPFPPRRGEPPKEAWPARPNPPNRGGSPGDALSPVPVNPRPRRGHDTATAKTPEILPDPEEVIVRRNRIHNRV